MNLIASCLQKLRNIRLMALFIIIWAVAIASLLAVHYFINKRPKIDKTEINRFKEIAEALSAEERAKLKYYEAGVIKFPDGKLALISDRYSLEEIMGMGLSLKEIDFRVEDPLLLERQMMVREAFRHLNEAEKHLVADRYAVIIYYGDKYCLVYDPRIYSEYIQKYGTECKTCRDKNKGGKNEDEVKSTSFNHIYSY